MDVRLSTWNRPFAPWRSTDGRVFDVFSYDTETTEIDHDRPALTPSYVVGAACDGRRGVFIAREQVPAYFRADEGAAIICHNASFDLRVTDVLLRPVQDIYRVVDENRVWDTLILHRLYTLGTEGHTARSGSSLDDCCRGYLGVALQKNQVDDNGKSVRLSFGQFLGRPPSSIPGRYLTYLAQDTLATWYLFQDLYQRIGDLLRRAQWGLGLRRRWLASRCCPSLWPADAPHPVARGYSHGGANQLRHRHRPEAFRGKSNSGAQSPGSVPRAVATAWLPSGGEGLQ